MFYHIKNLQSTKTLPCTNAKSNGFITLRIYKVLKPAAGMPPALRCFITLRIYKVLKLSNYTLGVVICFITLRIYKVLKHTQALPDTLAVLSH